MNEAKTSMERMEAGLTDRRGFVLPVIVFALVVMSVVAVAMLLTSSDEDRSARAMREASEAFYAAEAGLNAVYANWDSAFQVEVDAIGPGDSLVLEWTALMGGSQYRAVVHRWHEGGQPLYELTAEGRGPGALSGQRMLSYTLTAGPGDPGRHLRLGGCCSAAVTMRGRADLEDDSGVDGHDANPPGWEDYCENAMYDKPGLLMQDTTLLTTEHGVTVTGEPPLAEDPTLDDVRFEEFDGISWMDIAAMATKVVNDHDITPRPSTKIVNGEVVCNYADPLNMGSDDPNHPCFDYFPIVLIKGDSKFVNGGYAQGVFVLAEMGAALGSELDIEDNARTNGLILGKGCIEVQDNASFHGAIFVDSKFYNTDICAPDVPYDMHGDDPVTQYSTCAIDRALIGTGLDEWSEAEEPGQPSGVRLLSSRGFGELLR